MHDSPAVEGLLSHGRVYLQGIAAMSLPSLDDIDDAPSGQSSTKTVPGWSSGMDALDVALDFQYVGMDSGPGDRAYGIELSISTKEDSHSLEW